jgi:Trk K+ transport system NAD-binding subunit
MQAFGTPTIVNPFDRFGEHLRLALKAPDSYQLLTWLEAGPGAKLPERGSPPTHGRWIMCGYGRFGREVTADLQHAGLEVTIIEPIDREDPQRAMIVGDASEPQVLVQADVAAAVGLVAGSDNDTTNLSMLANARRLNPRLYLAARQNLASSAALFTAMNVDALLVPTEVVAHEVYAQLSTPLLWRFIQDMPVQGNQWAADLTQRLRHNCGRELPALWKIKLDREQAPALTRWLGEGKVGLAELLRSPEDRKRSLRIVPLLLLRNGEAVLTPEGATVLAPEDELLCAGEAADRRALESTLVVDSVAAYVLFDEHIPSSWIWRRLSRKHTSPT